MRTKRLQHLIQYSVISWFSLLVLCIFAIKSLELTTDRVQFSVPSSSPPWHVSAAVSAYLCYHRLYLRCLHLWQSAMWTTARYRTGTATDYDNQLLFQKSFNLIRRILNIYNSSWNTNWEYGELFQRSHYIKIIICNCSLQCSCTVHWPGGVLVGGCLIVLWGHGLYLMVWWLIAAITWLRSSHSNKFIELLALGGWL